MEKKEFYHHMLPHFQQPGQAYFITWNLRNAIAPKALIRYTQKLALIKSQMEGFGPKITESSSGVTNKHDSEIAIERLKLEYYTLRKKYLKAYDDLLDTQVNSQIKLTKPENMEILFQAFQFWEGKKLKNIAYCIMPNHVHWVFELFEKCDEGRPVYLQDVLQSVKRSSSISINKIEHRAGPLWQKESFDTTIRDDKHLFNAIRYTIYNPVKAGLVSEWQQWKGTWCECSDFQLLHS